MKGVTEWVKYTLHCEVSVKLWCVVMCSIPNFDLECEIGGICWLVCALSWYVDKHHDELPNLRPEAVLASTRFTAVMKTERALQRRQMNL